jgi:hypothetical protein
LASDFVSPTVDARGRRHEQTRLAHASGIAHEIDDDPRVPRGHPPRNGVRHAKSAGDGDVDLQGPVGRGRLEERLASRCGGVVHEHGDGTELALDALDGVPHRRVVTEVGADRDGLHAKRLRFVRRSLRTSCR